MSTIGTFAKNIGLAMAGKNPWGAGSGKGSGEEPSGDGDSSDGNKPKGPRNPWLPGGGDEPRRSANVEDIFKRRGGGHGGGSGGGSGGGFKIPERPGGKSWFPVVAGGLAAVWVLATSVHPIGTAEQGLVTWVGGKYSRTLDSGFKLTFPAPIQSVDTENVQEIRSVKIPEGSEPLLILTGDQNLVDMSYLIRWNINDLALFRYRLADPVDTVQEAAETAMRQSVAELDLDTVISGEGRAEIEQNVRMRMQRLLDSYKAGISVQGIEIDKADPPETVIEAFKDVSAAEQDAQRDKNAARRYSQQLLARAQGDSAAFNKIYDEYRLAPEVTRRRLYYETMERVLSQTDKTIIEADGVTPYLPLPEIRKRSQAAAQPQTAEGQ